MTVFLLQRQRLLRSFSSGILMFLLFNDSWCTGEDEYNDGNYYQNSFKVCEDSVMYVEDISLLCDSPGAYYYGSGRYRNSGTCVVGDKAKVSISFQIVEEMEDEETIPRLDLSVAEYGYQSESIYEGEKLCALDSLVSKSGSQCPEVGYYEIDVNFYLSDGDGVVHNENGESFRPKVIIGFKENLNDDDYSLGGANLDGCDVNNYTNGPLRVTANNIANFFLTFGILILAVLSVAIFGYCMYVQMQPEAPSLTDNFNVVDDDYVGGTYTNYNVGWMNNKSIVDILET